jgi:chloride channel 3/4/5
MDNAKPILLGYITRPSLISALSSKTDLDPDTDVIFTAQPHTDPSSTLDLRSWMEQTPITLNAKATLQLTVNMFQRLGLRYVLFIERGLLRGLLTKRDVWIALERGRERESVSERADMRGGHEEDGRGLLDDDEESPTDERRGLG